MNGRTSTIRVFASTLVSDLYTKPFRPYSYNGVGRVVQPKPKPPKPKSNRALPGQGVFLPDACGTARGHSRHVYYKVPICQPCRDAKQAYVNERRAKKAAA